MIIPSGHSQINMRFGGTAIPRGAEVTFGHQNSGALSPSAIGAGVVAAFTASLKGYTSSVVVLDEVLVKNGPNSTGPAAVTPAGIACSGSGQTDPPNVAFLVGKVTSLGGRHGRGRFFLPCPSEGSVNNDGTVEASAYTAIQGLLDDFYADLFSNDIIPELLHSDSTAPNDILGFVLDHKVATQRRRLRK